MEELNEKHPDPQMRATLQAEDCTPADTDATMAIPINIVCVPARDEADETIGTMLAQLLERVGQRALCVPLGTIAEMLDQMAEEKPEIVLISTLPPFALTHARTLYKKIRARFPRIRILIGVWNFSGEIEMISARLGPEVRGTIVTDLATAVQQLRTLANRRPDSEGSAAIVNDPAKLLPISSTDRIMYGENNNSFQSESSS